MMMGNRTAEEVDNFFNDLDTAELDTLLKFIKNTDPLEMAAGKPKFDSDTIDLIQKVDNFVTYDEVDA